MKFAKERATDALADEMKPLWDDHYAEIIQHKDIPLTINQGVYYAMQEADALRIYTVRSGIQLVGYQIFIVSRHPHFYSSLQAVQDSLYLAKPYRRGLTGYRFIQWCDWQLEREGVSVVYQHIPITKDIGPVLFRLGYDLHEIVYSRRLNDGK